MSELNREQVKKELVLFMDDNPIELHFNHKKTSKFLSFLKLVLDVITTDEQKIFELEKRLKECENGYEGTLYLERCKLHDTEQKIKELTEENERLRAEKESGNKEQFYKWKKLADETADRFEGLYQDAKKALVADTVRKMQERLTTFFANDETLEYTEVDAEYINECIDQIAEEIIEGETK